MWYQTQKRKLSQGLVLSSLGSRSWGSCADWLAPEQCGLTLGSPCHTPLCASSPLGQGGRKWGSLHLLGSVGTEDLGEARKEGGWWQEPVGSRGWAWQAGNFPFPGSGL